jgi:DNA-binding NarL/FixJ family response regulator
MTKTCDDPITILIVDHQTLFRQGLQELLKVEEDLAVVAQSGTADEAVAAAERSRPDVVLLDVEIPGEDCRATLHRLQRASPGSHVIALSSHDDPTVVQELLRLGASGYLLKTVSWQELVSAIRGVCGEAKSEASRVIVSISRESMAQAGDTGPLSEREKEILLLVAEALSNAQIGARLSITEGTVKRHLRKIFDKLDAVSRIDAVNKAAAASIIPAPVADGGVRRGRVTPGDRVKE